MNVYDFDETIYDGDCTVDFLKESLKHPKAVLLMIVNSYSVILYALHIWDKTKFKSCFFNYIKGINNIDKVLEVFHQKNAFKIKQWYLDQQKDDDVIISASPYFLVEGFCKPLGIKHIYGTDMNKYSGKINGENCKEEAKVRLFYNEFKDGIIDEFYSDSKSDNPLAKISKKAFLVKKNERLAWPKEWLHE